MKLNKLITFIKENSEDGEVRLYPSALSKLGIDNLEADKLIGELSRLKAVLHWRIAFAPNKILSTVPKQASFSSVKNGLYDVPVFLLNIDQGRFDEIFNENLKSIFDDSKSAVQVGKQTIELPPFKNEHCFCRVAFKYPVGKAVDWSEIYEDMTGIDVFEDKNKAKGKWRMVYDAMEAVNGKVREQTDSNLFQWKEKTVRRLY